MRRLSDEQWRSLASALAREAARRAPDWTAHNTHDPGITVLEVLVYALTELQYRSDSLDESGRALARRVAQLAGSLGVAAAGGCPPGLKRVNYVTGLVLGADDFIAEQEYVRAGNHRRNRLLHGAGIVSGLGVTLERTGGSARVVIAPGFALNARGEEIEVSAPTALPLPAQGRALLVLLHYAEQPCRPMPVLGNDTEAQTAFSRIAETYSATLASTPDDTAVALARVNFSRGRWMLDRKFRAAKVRV
jgi:hypothetical protein